MSGSIQSYRDLTAWQRAMDLAEAVYRSTQSWPRDELYGLTNQARRAAASVPANIAEGKGRYGAAEFLHHLSIAKGSLHEMETHLLLGQRLGYMPAADAESLLTHSAEVGRLLTGLIRSLRAPAP
jgi:four helix bundle protein